MLRIALWLVALCGPVCAADLPFVQALGFTHHVPGAAKGALVWIHGTYGKDQSGPPNPPDFVGREAAAGLDIWCFNRDRADDPLPRGRRFSRAA